MSDRSKITINNYLRAEYFHIGHVGKVNVFFITSLGLSIDNNVPTLLNHSPGWAEIEGYLPWVFFLKVKPKVLFWAFAPIRAPKKLTICNYNQEYHAIG